jgi:DNA-binding CsgD family transcriptional regulator
MLFTVEGSDANAGPVTASVHPIPDHGEDPVVPLAAMAALADVVEAVGTPRFGDALIAGLASIVAIDQIAAVTVRDESSPQLLSVASRSDASTARSLTRDYLARYHLDDPLLRALRDLHRSRAVTVLRHDASGTTPGYEKRFFSATGLIDKVALLWWSGRTAYYVNLYRNAQAGRYSERDIGRLNAMAPLIARLVERHAGRIAIQQAGRSGGTDVHALLVDLLDRRLSRRERDVLTGTLRGIPTSGIATLFGIAPTSVATLRRRAYAKLGISSQAELFNRCLALLPDIIPVAAPSA